MISYTKANINIISLIITIIIFISTQFLQNTIFNNFKIQIINPFKINAIEVKMNETSKTKEKWKIQIPKINLEAKISEGTEEKTLEDYVGHFQETSKEKGNICLAAHNRGYKNNYFARIKELQKGDEICYQYNNFTKTYVVEKQIIIQDTDWTNLEDTKENVITLITCVENEPNLRRCVQAIEKKG